MLRLNRVSKSYSGVPALVEVSLDVEPGEFVALVGRSGCGKSTLLNLAGAMDFPTSGEVSLDGVITSSLGEAALTRLRREKVGFVFQSFHLLPYRTSIENVMLAQVYADEPRRRRHAAAMAALAQVGLDHRAHALPTALSGGERQRVAIARALVNRPSLLMCDEPTGNLDTATTDELSDLLESLHRAGATLVVITHNPAVASRAQRQIAIRDGELTEISGATTPPVTVAPGPPGSGAPEPPPALPQALPPAETRP